MAADNRSCVICIPAIHGGRLLRNTTWAIRTLKEPAIAGDLPPSLATSTMLEILPSGPIN